MMGMMNLGDDPYQRRCPLSFISPNLFHSKPKLFHLIPRKKLLPPSLLLVQLQSISSDNEMRRNKKDHLFWPPVILFLLAILLPSVSAFVSHGLTNAEAGYIRRRQLLYYLDENGDRGEYVKVDPSYQFANTHLRDAYIALQAWKHAILSDPFNLTANWVGPDVCKYTGVYCAPAPYDPYLTVVAGIDLNHGDIAGYLPEELGLLVDLTLFHVNSNRICGTLPHKFDQLKLLHELDLSNNRFEGKFPEVILRLPSLKFLDIRFNEFEGAVPKELFDLPLDALFINSNRFQFQIPDNIGNSPVSVLVLANNKFSGCLPAGIANMSKTLNEIILMNCGLNSCVPPEFGLLKELTVLDISYNKLMGNLPEFFGGLEKIEQLDVAHNMLTVISRPEELHPVAD
ncbi:hypothetical protein LUZ63_019331 [Rhynchospora breviuscula]|uniref:Cell wall hydroxyproline-rich glycoprotein n=1 Tax=Rhynchospora breviuscula TaxID=2022672 RepID=A0A9Q0HIX5_9POAL|nr:hypothetical protein LUZ63_019331 [Rhynchospora breviuscula]